MKKEIYPAHRHDQETDVILKKPLFIRAWLAFTCLVPVLVTVPPLQADEKTAATANPTWEEPKGIMGIAVHYKKKYHGRRTHSGKKYNKNHLTAAHPHLPHGTKVKVINLANNRSVLVTINDRCRRRGYELIDLSHAAASKLGMLGHGKTRVRMIPLEEGE